MKSLIRRARHTMVPLFVALAACSGPATAADFPSKPITIIVAGPPAGATDAIARTLAADLAILFKQSVIVDNRAGAGGIIGTKSMLNAAADGHTLLLGHVATNAIVPAVVKPKPYDPVADFAAISLVGTSPSVLVVSAKSNITSLAGLLALGRHQAGGLTYGSPGVGLSQHIAGVGLAKASGVEMVHVPYRGSAPALVDLVSGQISMMFVTPGAAAPYLKSGQIRALAVTSRERNRFFEGVPTMAELGFPQVEQLSWFGVFAPAGTPAAVAQELSASIGRVMENPRTREVLEGLALELASDTSPEYFSRFVQAEVTKWAEDVKKLGVTQD
jgi:tripartite-type tricarboxylate transporter receptor subunit TctC